jgi:hypothetical protein
VGASRSHAELGLGRHSRSMIKLLTMLSKAVKEARA